MEQNKGTVEDIELKEGPLVNGKPKYTLRIYTIKGKKYSSFDDLKINKGDYVLFETEQKGSYLNIKSAVKSEEKIEVSLEDTKRLDYNGNLFEKWFVANTTEEIENKSKSFKVNHKVIASQSHYRPVIVNGEILEKFCIVLFYEQK